jgi:hypothetical protein
MRHVLLPRTPATAPRRMGQPTAPACLIALAGHPLGLLPRFLRAAAGTVNLAAVATAADQRLDPAARTQEQPGRAFRQIGLDRAWTASAAGGILPRHACSAPCEARRRTRTWRFRSAPCLPFSKWSSAPLCSRHRCDAAIAPAARDHLWICGQRKGVAHIPTGSATSASISWIHLEGASGSAQPRSPLGSRSPRPKLRLGKQLRHLCADPDSHPHSQRPSRALCRSWQYTVRSWDCFCAGAAATA